MREIMFYKDYFDDFYEPLTGLGLDEKLVLQFNKKTGAITLAIGGQKISLQLYITFHYRYFLTLKAKVSQQKRLWLANAQTKAAIP